MHSRGKINMPLKKYLGRNQIDSSKILASVIPIKIDKKRAIKIPKRDLLFVNFFSIIFFLSEKYIVDATRVIIAKRTPVGAKTSKYSCNFAKLG